MQCPQSQTIEARNANHSDLSLSGATYFPFNSESSTSASPSHTSEASSNHTLNLTQRLNEDVDEESLHAWLQKQRELQRNIRRVCGQYGDKIKVEVDTDWLIYEPKHKLLFCRNNKVIIAPPAPADQLTNAGGHNLLAGRLPAHVRQPISVGARENFRNQNTRDCQGDVQGPKHDISATAVNCESVCREKFSIKILFSQLSEDSNSFSVVRHPFVRCVKLLIPSPNTSPHHLQTCLCLPGQGHRLTQRETHEGSCNCERSNAKGKRTSECWKKVQCYRPVQTLRAPGIESKSFD